MSSSSQHDQFRRALVQAGVPPQRRRRLIAEYRDHRTELERELREADVSPADIDAEATARLGEPGVLARVASQRLQNETFAGRRPAVGFTVLPLLSLLAALVVTLLVSMLPWVFVGQDRVVELLGVTWPMILYVLPALGGAWWYRVALQRGRGHGYGWLAALVFGLPTTFISTRVIPSDVPLRSVFQFIPEATPSWAALVLLVGCVAVWQGARLADRTALQA